MGLNRNPYKTFKIIKGIGRAWKEIEYIEYHSLRHAIRSLYQSKLIGAKQNKDGSITLQLSDLGRQRALTYKLETMVLKKKRWDYKWRLVIFDIPNNKRRLRETLRFYLRQLDFYKLQKSVYITPYKCEREIEFLVEYFKLKKHVRFMVVKSFDNQLDVKKYFGLIK